MCAAAGAGAAADVMKCVCSVFFIISNSTQIIHLSETPYSKSLYITIQLRQCAIVLQLEVWASVRMNELMGIQVISRKLTKFAR